MTVKVKFKFIFNYVIRNYLMKVYGQWRYSSIILDLGTQMIRLFINLDLNFMQEEIVNNACGLILISPSTVRTYT
jgi:hypothetical protein